MLLLHGKEEEAEVWCVDTHLNISVRSAASQGS